MYDAKIIGALVLVAVLGLLGFGVWYYKSSYEEALQEKAALQTKYDQAYRAADQCNDSVEELQAESRKKAFAVAKAIEEASKTAAVHIKKSQDLLSAVRKGKDACESADILFNEYIDGRQAK